MKRVQKKRVQDRKSRRTFLAAESEDEQLEMLKNWWDENGNSLIIGVVVVLAVTFGYRAWDNSVIESAVSASSMYEDLKGSIANIPATELPGEALASARSLGDKLKIEYGNTAYAQFGALFMARLAMEMKEYEKAETELRWVLDNDVDKGLEIITRMRLARVLAVQDRVNEALLVLSSDIDPGNFQSSWEEVRGDLYYQSGDNGKARQAYQKAFDVLDQDQPRALLKMKLDDLSPVIVAVESDAA